MGSFTVLGVHDMTKLPQTGYIDVLHAESARPDGTTLLSNQPVYGGSFEAY